jgi:hypothetical protein
LNQESANKQVKQNRHPSHFAQIALVLAGDLPSMTNRTSLS